MKIVKKQHLIPFDASFNILLDIDYKKYAKIDFEPSISEKENEIIICTTKFDFNENLYTAAKNKINIFLNGVKELKYYHIIKYFEEQYDAYVIYDEIDYLYYGTYENPENYLMYKDKYFVDNFNNFNHIETPNTYISNESFQQFDAFSSKEEIYFYIVIELICNEKLEKEYPDYYKNLKIDYNKLFDSSRCLINEKSHHCPIELHNVILRIGIDHNNKVTSIINTGHNCFPYTQYDIECFKELIYKQYNLKGDKNEF